MEDIQTAQVQESIKLEKNSRGYNWESRVIFLAGDTEESFRKRIIDRNEFMLKQFGGEE